MPDVYCVLCAGTGVFNNAPCADCDPDDLPGDFGPAYPEPECWGETSYEHYKGECRHFAAALETEVYE